MNKYLIFGFKETVHSKKMVLLLFLITFILGLFAALPFKMSLSSQLGNLPETFKLLKGFDYTVYNDIMHNFGGMIKSYISRILWFAIGFYFFWMILSGGILNIFVKREKFTLQAFASGCGAYAWRFIRAGLYVLIPQLLIGGGIVVGLAAILESSLKTFDSESTVIYIVLIGVSLFLILYSFMRLVLDYAKIIVVQHDTKVLKSIWQATTFVIRHLLSTYFLYIAILIFQIIAYAFYFSVNSLIGSVSIPTLIIMVIIQQGVVLLRIFAKVWLYSGEVELYENKYSG